MEEFIKDLRLKLEVNSDGEEILYCLEEDGLGNTMWLKYSPDILKIVERSLNKKIITDKYYIHILYMNGFKDAIYYENLRTLENPFYKQKKGDIRELGESEIRAINEDIYNTVKRKFKEGEFKNVSK